jgi:hypothetical protein
MAGLPSPVLACAYTPFSPLRGLLHAQFLACLCSSSPRILLASCSSFPAFSCWACYPYPYSQPPRPGHLVTLHHPHRCAALPYCVPPFFLSFSRLFLLSRSLPPGFGFGLWAKGRLSPLFSAPFFQGCCPPRPGPTLTPSPSYHPSRLYPCLGDAGSAVACQASRRCHSPLRLS